MDYSVVREILTHGQITDVAARQLQAGRSTVEAIVALATTKAWEVHVVLELDTSYAQLQLTAAHATADNTTFSWGLADQDISEGRSKEPADEFVTILDRAITAIAHRVADKDPVLSRLTQDDFGRVGTPIQRAIADIGLKQGLEFRDRKRAKLAVPA